MTKTVILRVVVYSAAQGFLLWRSKARHPALRSDAMQAFCPLRHLPAAQSAARSTQCLRAIGAALALAAAVMILPHPLRADPAQDATGLTGLQRLDLSMRLHRAGRAAADPVLVLAAARLRASVALAGPREIPVGMEGALPPLEAASMLQEAHALAKGDDALIAVIEDSAAERPKGLASGPLHRLGTIAPGGRNRYFALPFRGGEYAEVYAEAQGAADLLLTILDAEGRTVCADSDHSAIAYCGWRPEHAGEFTIVLENRGEGASYALMTN